MPVEIVVTVQEYCRSEDNLRKCRKLERMVVAWGGCFTQLSSEQFYSIGEKPGVDAAPFTPDVAVHYEKRIIYYVKPLWYELVHEMGHVFASRIPPRKSDEWSFLGWEYALARQLKDVRRWLVGNGGYSIPNGDDIGALTKREVNAMLLERLRAAIALGLVVDGKAVSVR